ncbi:TonB-dependent receptor plug domain-containing protein [Aureibaculum sp. A20]|uniref:TonB-dependent receptor plug domain-containing protein n=1 Tax=Aureibaculum flavum TaxID=2795986 RepID=A0ABS0WWV8_9FLAO|nr:TonB-dependent receptor plug domain-containing protein [Aureibaculum flavum]MBJ2176474.1 TonB-dependent receptor plug domain-containing protein [Aureibaculum flavum]
MKNFLKCTLLLVSFTTFLHAQERTVTGMVTTFEDIAVINAEVTVSSSKISVFTDSIGQFKISCLDKDKIKIRAKGFSSQKVKIDDKTEELKINLVFKPGKKGVDVAVGYGHIDESDKSFAITSIKNESKYEFTKYSNVIDAIVNSSPAVTYNGSGITIRGESSLLGSSYALIILNGISINMGQLAALSTSDVKSVDILKGGAAAIYGSRGANGVVIITTKSGGKDE